MLIKNRYEIDENNPLGKGGFGKTYLAKDRDRFGELCVVKELIFSQTDPNFAYSKEMFEQEARVLHNLGEVIEQIPTLKHQIPKLHAYFTEEGQFYLVQQWVPGQTLAQQVTSQVLNEKQIRQFLVDILPVLQVIHERGIVHRDIKPSNVIMRASDGKPVLIDFGIVKGLVKTSPNPNSDESNSTQIGTPGFSPPEQRNGESIHPYTDIYSLGITAIYALTGITSDNWSIYQTGKSGWRKFATSVSYELGQILDKAIQPSPDDRFRTAQEMLTAILSLPPITEPLQTTRPDPVSPSHKLPTKPSRVTPVIVSIVGMLAAIAAGYVYSYYQILQADQTYQQVQADLKKIKDFKQQENHQACIAEAQRFTHSHTLSYFNPRAEVEQLENECAVAAVKKIEAAKAKSDHSTCITEAKKITQSQLTQSDSISKAKQLQNECNLAMNLQNYLRVDVLEILRNRNQPEVAKAVSTIQPAVNVESDQVTIVYDGSTNSDFVTDSGIQGFAAFFMSALRGQSVEYPVTKYANFSKLIVSAKGQSKAATVTKQQWDAYLEKFKKAASPVEKESIRKQFIEQIQISAR